MDRVTCTFYHLCSRLSTNIKVHFLLLMLIPYVLLYSFSRGWVGRHSLQTEGTRPLTTTKPGATKQDAQKWEGLYSMRKHSGVPMFVENPPRVSSSFNTILGTRKLALTEIIVGRDGVSKCGACRAICFKAYQSTPGISATSSSQQRGWNASGGNYFRLSFSTNGATSLAPWWLGASRRLLSIGFKWR